MLNNDGVMVKITSHTSEQTIINLKRVEDSHAKYVGQQDWVANQNELG